MSEQLTMHVFARDRQGAKMGTGNAITYEVRGFIEGGRALISMTGNGPKGTWQVMRIYADDTSDGWSGEFPSAEAAFESL